MSDKINIYEDERFFGWLRKIGNYGIKCPECNKSYEPRKSLVKSTMFCTNCNKLWRFRRSLHSWKWYWSHIPRINK